MINDHHCYCGAMHYASPYVSLIGLRARLLRVIHMRYGMRNRAPSLKVVKSWGCLVFIEKLKTDKLESRFDKGYYFCFPSDQRVLISRDVVFLEKEFL